MTAIHFMLHWQWQRDMPQTRTHRYSHTLRILHTQCRLKCTCVCVCVFLLIFAAAFAVQPRADWHRKWYAHYVQHTALSMCQWVYVCVCVCKQETDMASSVLHAKAASFVRSRLVCPQALLRAACLMPMPNVLLVASTCSVLFQLRQLTYAIDWCHACHTHSYTTLA